MIHTWLLPKTVSTFANWSLIFRNILYEPRFLEWASCMESEVGIYSMFFYIKKSIFWYQKIFFDINEIVFLISKNRFFDIKKSIFWYQKIDFLISEIDFLISENIFWYQKIFFYIKKWKSFLMSKNNSYFLISKNELLISEIHFLISKNRTNFMENLIQKFIFWFRKSFSDIKK